MLERFDELGASVVGCSPDGAASHRAFIQKHELAVMLLSDHGHPVLRAYGAFGEKQVDGEKSVGVKRSTVLIDPDGKLAHHWKGVTAAGHAARVAERLAELRGS